MSEEDAQRGDTCWAFGHETEDEPVCIRVSVSGRKDQWGRCKPHRMAEYWQPGYKETA